LQSVEELDRALLDPVGDLLQGARGERLGDQSAIAGVRGGSTASSEGASTGLAISGSGVLNAQRTTRGTSLVSPNTTLKAWLSRSMPDTRAWSVVALISGFGTVRPAARISSSSG
jgi:hypothetical protein